MSKKPTAQPNDDDTIPKKKRGSVLSWVLLGLLVAGLSGFGVENFGGGVTTIGKVGEREIAVNDYARLLNNQIRQVQRQFGMALPFEQIQALGIDRQALEQVVTANALAGEAQAIGLSAGDVRVATEIAKRPDFQSAEGGFDRDSYRVILEQNNLTVPEFETSVREDIARGLLQGAVVGGLIAPKAAVDTLHAWQGETRELVFLPLADADLPVALSEPDAGAVQVWYDQNIATYTRPEATRLRYVALTPEIAGKATALDAAEVRRLYDDRIDQYVVPEKRLVERLVYPDDAAATAAKARLDAGESFETLVADRKLSLTDIDMGDVTQAELGAAGAAVFALSEPGIVGPLPSDLGVALYRMNAVLAAQNTPFDAVKVELEAELQVASGISAVSDRVEAIDDLLAGGGTLDDMAGDLGIAVLTTDYARGATDNIDLAANPAFQKAAEALAKDSFPEAILLEDGSLIAMEFVETMPPTPLALDVIRDRVTADARAQALNTALAARAEAIRSELVAGKALADFGAPVSATVTRGDALPELPAGLTTKGFGMSAEELVVWSEADLTGLLQVKTITAAPVIGGTADDQRKALADEYRASIEADVFALYSKAITDKAGLQLDQGAINAVHSQIMRN